MRLALALVVLALPGIARGYALRRTERGAILHWSQPPKIWADETLDRVTGSAEASRAAVEAAVGAWAAVEGAGLESLDAGSSTGGLAGYDADHPDDNRSEVFAAREVPGEAPDALAVTLVTYDTATGEILDADTLVRRNARFGLDGEPHRYDLPSVLTHEVGHALGLAHETTLEDATMYPSTPVGETGQRTLSPDDESAALAVYGVGAEVLPPSAGACAAAPGRAARPTSLLVAIGLFVLLRRPR